MTDKPKTIYDLKLHESIMISPEIDDRTRVPGGWIYLWLGYWKCAEVFVPFDNEFLTASRGRIT
jgi:hypothetical protein